MRKVTRLMACMIMGMAVMLAGCNKDENDNSTSDGNGGGQTAAGWVDLGLPSGLLWATCNFDATSPEGYGDYYDWGEATMELQAMDVLLGNGARMPTFDEWIELINNTTAEWTTMNGVNGRKFTAANGNSLFLPAAGSRDGEGLANAGRLGCYWSSSLYESESYSDDAWYFYFGVGVQRTRTASRYSDHSVRPVRSAR